MSPHFVLLLLAVLCAMTQAADRFADKTDESGRFSFNTASSTSDSSSSSSSSGSNDDDDDASSDTLRAERFARDQARIELAVQDALLADTQAQPFPARELLLSKSYQLTFTTLLDRLPNDDVGLVSDAAARRCAPHKTARRAAHNLSFFGSPR